MANTILITANWHTGALSQQTISRQYDNNRYAVRFVGYPEASDGNKLDYYLLVWMSTAPGQKLGEITPIQLNSDQWYISNYFTQQVQVIKFQLCVLNEAGTYEAHSPIFSGRIGDSLEHDGTSHDIDVSTLFDAYREYLNELIIRAGAVIIDPTPTQGSPNAVSSGGVYEAIHDTDPTLTQSGQAADAKVVGDKINNGYASITDIINGSFNKNGALNTRSDRLRPATFIPVKTGDKIVISAGSLKHACGAWNGVPSTETLVRNDDVFSTADETIVSEIDGFYIVVFAKQDTTQRISPADFDGYIHLYSGEIYKNTQRITQAEDEISSLQSEINTAFAKVIVPVYETEEIELVKSSGYYPPNGVYADSSSYEHSQKIAVSEGDVLKPASTQPGAYFRFICAYNGNSVVASAGMNNGPTSYTVPSGIDGVIVSTVVSQHETSIIIKRKTGEETRVYPIGQKLGNFNWKGDLSDGDSVELSASNVRFNVVWCFTGHVSTMGKITIGIKSTDGTVKELCSGDSPHIY